MKAYDFEYDGRNLSSFGMIMASFGSKGVETISNGAEITFNTVSSFGGSKHYRTSSQYENTLEATIQICKNSCYNSNMEITSTEFRELTKWLNRKSFLKFKILDGEHIDLYYECSFVNISRIELNGKIIGLELTLETNRPFALKEPQIYILKSHYVYYWDKYSLNDSSDKLTKLGTVSSINEGKYPTDGIQGNYWYVYTGMVFKNKHSINDTSYEEGFIYPHVEIEISESGNLTITNSIENREMIIKNCTAGEIITLDYPIIKSSNSSHNIQNDFNWNWFRIANTYNNSRNDITVSIPSKIEIEYSPVVKVGI